MLPAEEVEAFVSALSTTDEERKARYPGDRLTNQPVHTCYVPAHQFRPDTVTHWGTTALETLRANPIELPAPVRERVERKLATQPIEDLRIDFEDGYGAPDDETEDADAIRAAKALPDTPYVGLRIKSFDTAALRRRAIRTLDLFLTSLDGPLPPGLLITFPKVTGVRQVEVFVNLLAHLETQLGIGPLAFEIQVETPQTIIDSAGRIALPSFIEAGQGRVRGLHFGTYDYTAGLGLPTTSQHLAHHACDFARHIMQVSAAGTGIWCSDGSTNILPVGDAIQHGWQTHATLVRRSLDHGFYQGWDLHPNQLVTRYATVYAFYRNETPNATARLTNYLDHTAGTVADEPATARMLAVFLLRALRCGAVDPGELPLGQDRLRQLL
ncbi:MAG TPA: aldolase [Pseudonocardiaceae bacterium]|nr:aldolase [Pseudonocardiaceae bacterium]